MDEINKFIDEIRTIDIDFDHNSASRKIIALSELTKYKDESTYEGYNYIYLYDIIHRSKNDLKEAYNNALLSLNHLSKKEILNAAIQVTNYCLGDILKLVSNCNRDYISNKLEDRQRSKLIKTIRKLSFDNISSDHLSIMSQCYLSYEFFHKLIDELTDKNIYQIKLMKDIRVILNGIIKSEKKENPHSPLIYEKSILRLLTEKIRIHDGIEESMLSETGKDKLNVSASAAVNNVEILNKSDKEENNGTTPHIKTLFSFIDFLHANIDNFNQYDNVLLELNEMFERFFQLGFHIEEIIERKALQKEIDAKWNIITDNIVTPIKEKVAELNLFDWSAPETFDSNYFEIANTLNKTCEKKDFDAIYYAKGQYIEFTNEISSNVISNVTKEAQSMFEFLNKMMFEIAKNFSKEGDKPIKKIVPKQVDDIQKEIESYKSGEIASLPLNITSQLPQVEVKEEQNTIPQPSATSQAVSTEKSVGEDEEGSFTSKVDIETLSKYFHPKFKGRGNNNPDHFSQLIKDIKLLDNQKEIGQLALMIFESKNINSQMPDTFSSWYRIFCKCVGGKVTYKKSQLRNPKNSIKLIFNYIEPK